VNRKVWGRLLFSGGLRTPARQATFSFLRQSLRTRNSWQTP